MPGRRRPIDLAATLHLPNSGRRGLGVEVKVDSAWTPTQLTSIINEEDAGVLLAVGCTALAATQPELPGSWRLVGPAEWATIVDAHTEGDEALTSYAKHVRDEAESHERALNAVNAGRPVERSRKGSALRHWAYFCEVVAHSALGPSSGRWERKTLISGPLLTRWIERDEAPGRGVYIELMGHGGEDRELLREVLGRPRRPGSSPRPCVSAPCQRRSPAATAPASHREELHGLVHRAYRKDATGRRRLLRRAGQPLEGRHLVGRGLVDPAPPFSARRWHWTMGPRASVDSGPLYAGPNVARISEILPLPRSVSSR